jgi:zinc/manganese transport system permease protein
MMLYHLLIEPFADYGFMRRSLVACAAIAMGGAPLGVFLVLRRMALIGDAISHAILPGAALAFLFFGLSLPMMAAGGLAAGVLIALIAGSLTRFTQLKEDASFTGTYLLSLAFGVLIITVKGSAVDLMHVLFGNVLAVDNSSLLLVCSIATLSLLVLAAMYRSLIIECFDTGFMRANGTSGAWINQIFLMLLVLNLVAAFQALGTLMALGLMVLPAIAVRFWTQSIDAGVLLTIASSFIASFIGLLLSYHCNLPSGPAIVLTAGAFYLASVCFGRYGSLWIHFHRRRHFAH